MSLICMGRRMYKGGRLMNADEEERKWTMSSNDMGVWIFCAAFLFSTFLHPSFRGKDSNRGETFSTRLVILAAFRLYIEMNSNGNKLFS